MKTSKGWVEPCPQHDQAEIEIATLRSGAVRCEVCGLEAADRESWNENAKRIAAGAKRSITSKETLLALAECCEKPRVTLAQFRLLDVLWPYARGALIRDPFRNQLISDIFDGRFTREEVKPLVEGGFAVEEHIYDRSSLPRHYWTWLLTDLGEIAVFGDVHPARRAQSEAVSHEG